MACLCFPFLLQAQQYNVLLIPDSLKENANAVKRFEETRIIVKSTSKAIKKHKWAYTILNEKGDRFAFYSGYYDRFRSISDISGVLFDASGNKLKSIKKKDIADVSISDGFSLATDARAKRFSFYCKTYPYTVEFEDELEYEGIFTFPEWTPINRLEMSVQQSSMTVETPSDYKLRYKEMHYNGKAQISSTKNSTVYLWEARNLKAIEDENWQPEWRDITTSVFIAPSEFEYAGYKGSMESWKELGKFQIALNKERDQLPESIKQDVHAIADKLPTWKEKVCALYDYLQKNTRYISIQLGIGGLQPFDAKFVSEKKYGDCKALSNYMVSLLKEAGIKGYYTWVAAGSDESKSVIEDFPDDYFNHIITCVPNGKDTLWLECTSQTKSPGYMGTFTGNRKALLIGDDGGYLVTTPSYTSKENTQFRKIDASIAEDGTLTADVRTSFGGIQQELQHGLIHEYTEEERKKYLNNYIGLPTYNIEKSEYKEIKATVPMVEEFLRITSPAYASVTGKRLFIVPNLFNKGSKLSNDKPRKFDIEYDNAFIDVDTIAIDLPKGYEVEAMAKDVKIANKFGSYSISYKVDGNKVKVLRVHERNVGRYPASEYTDMVKFYEDVYKADRSRIVFVKKEG